MPTFDDFGREVMVRREEEGIRGVDRELSRYRCHIATAPFADRELGEIRSKDIRDWLKELGQKKCANDETKRLSRPTRHRIKTLTSAIFEAAVEDELIEENPCSGVKDRKAVDESDTRDKSAYLTHEEQKLIASCEAIPKADRLAILFSVYTGLRQSEFRYLELGDVHLDGPSPHIIVRYAGRSRRTKEKLPPKSGKTRKVPLIKEAQDVTREWLEMLPTWAPENPHGLMWPTMTGCYRQQGKPLGKSETLREHYKTAGITLRPHLHWHALRHTFGSSLMAGWWGRKWTLKEVQVVMGHSSVTITERYAHLGEDSIAQAAKETVMEAAMQPKTRAESPILARMFTRMFDAIRGAA